MKVAARPTQTDDPPRRKTYDKYVRIVEPGRHVFKSRISFGKVFVTLLGISGTSLFGWEGSHMRTDLRLGGIGIGFMCFMWACGLVMAVTTAWGFLHNTIVEITPRQISMKRRRFVGWIEKQSWELSSFTEATLQTSVMFGRGTRVPQYTAVLQFDTWDAFAMGDACDWKPDAEEFIKDITASVERARAASSTF